MNVGLTRSVLYYSIQNTDSSFASITPEEQSKLFWSFSFLEAFYGPPTMMPSIAGNISSPCFSVAELQLTPMPCPPLPPGDQSSHDRDISDIWSQSARICSLWQDLRTYVSSCMDGHSDAPWQPHSGYTKLCSRLLDLEEVYPTRLSYNSVKFPDRPPEEIQTHRMIWLPWVRLQITYHTIHCVLNHPFLYSFRNTKPILSPNTFWRGSFEKALRHCTWVPRLIRMAREKGLELADPFFAQAAGVAGTLHLYWTRSSDEALRASALANLQICQSLIANMARSWPVCRSIVSEACPLGFTSY